MKITNHLQDHKNDFDPEVYELADRFWRIHPKELQEKNIGRSLFYAQEIQKLVDKAKSND